jgi:signal peptidase I
MGLSRSWRWTLVRSAVIVAVAWVVFGFVLIPVRGSGISMRPAVEDSQLTFVNRVAYWREGPARTDIVALRLAGSSVVYIKRIVGLPTERIAIKGGQVFADDVPLDESYVARRRMWEVPEFVLGPEEYLVIGDNRDMRVEDHDFGRARRDRILGRVITW